MRLLLKSAKLIERKWMPPVKDHIIVITQFYIDTSVYRYDEIKYCLLQNIKNPQISAVVLLNEREYTPIELGLNEKQMRKVIQIVIGTRLYFRDAFTYIREQRYSGYFIIANSDIFFDTSLVKLRYSDLSTSRKMMAQLRFEFKPGNTEQIFGPRYDSQDSWIFHTNNEVSDEFLRGLNFTLGKPACDNKFAYLLTLDNFEIVNDPKCIKTLHYHTSQIRNYTPADVIPQPWCCIIPADYKYSEIMDSLGLKMANMSETMGLNNNDMLYEYVSNKLANNTPFVIPRVSNIDTTFAILIRILKESKSNNEIYMSLRHMNNTITDPINQEHLKVHTGIKLENNRDVMSRYSDTYLAAFENCDIYGGWNKNDGLMYEQTKDNLDYLTQHLCKNKRMFWIPTLEIFNYIKYAKPWTHALENKRILIVSPFEKSINKQLAHRTQLYAGNDLFPGCQFITISPPITYGNIECPHFNEVLDTFLQKLDTLTGQYDVALVSAGGYTNPIIGHIYSRGASAIYVGGVLQMYFGILGNRWFKERSDIIRMYLNGQWIRPMLSEKPEEYEKIRGGAYW